MAYETAIELAPSHPQLYYFFGGFLLRAFNDCKGAIEQFTSALKIDPDAIEVRRELARAKLYNYDFEDSEDIVTKALSGKLPSKKHELIFSDLLIQVYQREMSYRNSNGLDPDVEKVAGKLSGFVSSFDVSLVDETLFRHLENAKTSAIHVNAKRNLPGVQDLITSIETLVRKVEGKLSPHQGDPICSGDGMTNQRGYLKEKGRKPTFGFLVDGSGREVFFPRASVDEPTWTALQRGDAATYDVEVDSKGRFRATRVKVT